MAVAVKEDYQRALDEQKREGQTKDFYAVCDRLEKKYRDEAISN